MNQVKVYTKSYCPYCVKAKKLLDHKKVPYSEIDIENDPEFAENLFKQTGFRTVPQIFIGEKCIGGCDNLYDLEKNGELDSLLGIK